MLRVCVLVLVLLVGTSLGTSCTCPNASAFTPSSLLGGGCCLNVSGSDLRLLTWSWFSNSSGLEILDLSHCNITEVQVGAPERGPSSLSKLFLNHNGLSSLPWGLLSGISNLTELHLQENRITDLPRDFLQDQDRIRTLDLRGNELRFLPLSVLRKRSLRRLEMEGNPWFCSCQFVEEMESVLKTNCSWVQDALVNLTCASPSSLGGRALAGLSVGEVCRPAALTPLFIALPLLILSALLLCWCCGRNKKEIPALSSKKKPHNHSNGVNKPSSRPPPSVDSSQDDGDHRPQCLLQNQLLLCPSSGELCRGEAEGGPGSVDSFPSLTGEEMVEVELEAAVNVSEVLRDSTDREKAYLTQSTQYYSLVPGLQLDDWEHGDFDNVDLT